MAGRPPRRSGTSGLSRRRNKIVGRRHPDDRESKPEVTLEDTAVTRAELEVRTCGADLTTKGLIG
jgi:hypothetical protein